MAGITKRAIGWPADRKGKGPTANKRSVKLLKVKKTKRPKGKR